jgi:hypothetical protein
LLRLFQLSNNNWQKWEHNLSQGNNPIPPQANTIAAVFGLYMLIELFGTIVAAHFDAVVKVTVVLLKHQPKTEFAPYLSIHIIGASLRSWLAN